MANEQAPPPIAIGHVTLRVSDVGLAADFYRALGLRPIVSREGLAILGLRGGTHLVLFQGGGDSQGGPVHDFDFMVEDIEAAHAIIEGAGVKGTTIAEDHVGASSGSRSPTPTAMCSRCFRATPRGARCDPLRRTGNRCRMRPIWCAP